MFDGVENDSHRNEAISLEATYGISGENRVKHDDREVLSSGEFYVEILGKLSLCGNQRRMIVRVLLTLVLTGVSCVFLTGCVNIYIILKKSTIRLNSRNPSAIQRKLLPGVGNLETLRSLRPSRFATGSIFTGKSDVNWRRIRITLGGGCNRKTSFIG